MPVARPATLMMLVLSSGSGSRGPCHTTWVTPPDIAALHREVRSRLGVLVGSYSPGASTWLAHLGSAGERRGLLG